MTVERCRDTSAASWLLSQQREWYDLTARGPLGYERYARLRFIPDPAFDGQRESHAEVPDEIAAGPSELWQLAVAVSHLARHTTTPDDCYFLIWDGWPSGWPYVQYEKLGDRDLNIQDEQLGVVRSYYFFNGEADLFAWEDASNVLASPTRLLPDPAFTWPADRAWCITDDIDPHFATIGASHPAITDLLNDSRIDIVEDDPESYPPRYT
ncbi:hypothetical protein AAFP35_01400 [Gordonia sp. CPCC 206044]|uniref:hypothetical protein n=1 Tax=Gordonia sp. CPCC 206044 TaxID=3140793 RepID=UPI003AF3D25B